MEALRGLLGLAPRVDPGEGDDSAEKEGSDNRHATRPGLATAGLSQLGHTLRGAWADAFNTEQPDSQSQRRGWALAALLPRGAARVTRRRS